MRDDTARHAFFLLAAAAGFVPSPAWAAEWPSEADAFSAVVAGLVFVIFCVGAGISLWQEKRRASVSNSKITRNRLRKVA
ncbi:MAG: hypothetical protein AB1555_12450 [Nitrospirota bacterium]